MSMRRMLLLCYCEQKSDNKKHFGLFVVLTLLAYEIIIAIVKFG